MWQRSSILHISLACALAAALSGALSGTALADRDDDHGGKGKGKGKGHQNQQGDQGNHDRKHFEDRNRVVVREYYVKEYKSGHCPPGLAKKHNGCMPPGQAKKWKVGKPLPREVVYYELPPPLIAQIGPPPSGYRYVRVAGDILMIAIGTSMVVDAIHDLGR